MTPDPARQIEALSSAVSLVESRINIRPKAAVILGSGLGQLADKIEKAVSIPYSQIPGFSRSTAGGHRGELVAGILAGQPIVAMAGRLHRYEGHSNDDVAFPVRVMQKLGATVLVVSNAAGGVNPKLCVGDIVIIQDSIDWMRGPYPFASSSCGNCEVPLRRGSTYDELLADAALRCSLREAFAAYFGTYLATLGPNYETRAEYRMMRKLGIDVVGMSTVPEVLAARQLGMRVLALSMVSNVARPDEFVVANHEEVLIAGRAAAVKMEAIVRDVLASL